LLQRNNRRACDSVHLAGSQGMSCKDIRHAGATDRVSSAEQHQDGRQDSNRKHKAGHDLSRQHIDGTDFATTPYTDEWDTGQICLSTWADFLLPKRSIFHRLLYPRTVHRVLFLRFRFSKPGSDPMVGLFTLYISRIRNGFNSSSLSARCRASGRFTECNFATLGSS
jgi:hypothetical protein